MQVRLGDATGGMNIELLEPWDVERNDFDLFVYAQSGGADDNWDVVIPVLLDRRHGRDPRHH